MTISNAIEKLLDRLRSNQNTYESYCNTLKPFAARFGERDCSDVTTEEIRKFLGDLSGSPRTKVLKFMQIRAVFDEAQKAPTESGQPVKWGNPCLFLREEFRLPKENRKRISDTIHKEMRDVKKTLDERYQLIFDLGTRCGLRISEILQMKPEDLIRRDDGCYIQQKKEKDMLNQGIVRIPTDLCNSLWKYIHLKRIKKDTRIFPITRWTAYALFKSRGVTLRELRQYSVETKSLWLSFYIAPIKPFTEHTNIETTVRYSKTL